jgi:hypothetical protein
MPGPRSIEQLGQAYHEALRLSLDENCGVMVLLL